MLSETDLSIPFIDWNVVHGAVLIMTSALYFPLTLRSPTSNSPASIPRSILSPRNSPFLLQNDKVMLPSFQHSAGYRQPRRSGPYNYIFHNIRYLSFVNLVWFSFILYRTYLQTFAASYTFFIIHSWIRKSLFIFDHTDCPSLTNSIACCTSTAIFFADI